MITYAFAPMEGITNFRYRQIHRKYFPGIDKYYMPFMAPHLKGRLKNKEKNDAAPENNRGIPVVPQILTNDAESFIITAKMLRDMGYQEVNLNLGCPSPTVVTKGKGAGFLACPEALDHFFEDCFRALDGVIAISVKSRLGISDAREADTLFAIYEKYPISELIIHPRTREDYYRGAPDRQKYREIAKKSRHNLCYNGNVYTRKDCRELLELVPETQNIMIGRGLLRNPALVRELQGGRRLQKSELLAFHNELYDAYKELYSGPAAILGHMKELWVYMESEFEDCAGKIGKIRKARKTEDYEAAVRVLFDSCGLVGEDEAPRRTEEVCL